MRDVAIVSFAQSRNVRRENRRNEVEMLIPVVQEAVLRSGIPKPEIGFTCSGSSDYLAGQPFSFVVAVGLEFFGPEDLPVGHPGVPTRLRPLSPQRRHGGRLVLCVAGDRHRGFHSLSLGRLRRGGAQAHVRQGFAIRTRRVRLKPRSDRAIDADCC